MSPNEDILKALLIPRKRCLCDFTAYVGVIVEALAGEDTGGEVLVRHALC